MKLEFVWATSARAELRRIERQTAMRILLALTRYAETGEGDVKTLEGDSPALIGCESAIGGSDFAECRAVRFTFWRLRIGAKPTDG